MNPEQDRIIADAKRAARRLARTRSETYQTCLDIVAASAGRANWGAFLTDPASMPTAPGHAQEGIVLGLDDSGRQIRSARSSVVLCEGSVGVGKLLSTVLPTLMRSPTSSQIVNDPKPELLECARLIGYDEDRRILVINPLAASDHPDAVAFNPLHPAFRDGDDVASILDHASAIASTIIPSDRLNPSYFENKARDLLAAIIAHISLHPEDIPERADRRNHSRIASLPAVVDWMIEVFSGDYADPTSTMRSLKTAVALNQNVSGAHRIRDEFMGISGMMPKERIAVVGTMDSRLIFLKNKIVRNRMDPADPDAGAYVIRALEDVSCPTSVFLNSDYEPAVLTRTVRSLAIDAIGRWRARQGPSGRSLQFILDEAMTHLPPSSWLDSVLVDGAPAGCSVLLVTQTFSDSSFQKVAPSLDIDAMRFDAIVKLATNSPKKAHDWNRYLTATSLVGSQFLDTIKSMPPPDGSTHILITSKGAFIVRRDHLNPHRERSSRP